MSVATHTPCIPRNVLVSNLVSMIGMQKGRCNYLELGTAYNETLEFVAKSSPSAKCYGVDPRAIDPALPNVTVYNMLSKDYFDQFAAADGPFDVVFIDADHSYLAVLVDFARSLAHMADQSLILLDDTWPAAESETGDGYCSTAYKIVDWLKRAGYESVTIPAHPGLTIVRVSRSHLLWS